MAKAVCKPTPTGKVFLGAATVERVKYGHETGKASGRVRALIIGWSLHQSSSIPAQLVTLSVNIATTGNNEHASGSVFGRLHAFRWVAV